MKNKTLDLLVAAFAVVLFLNIHAAAQSGWLDQNPLPNWNSRSRAILQTERMPSGELARCGKFVRQPTLPADTLVAK